MKSSKLTVEKLRSYKGLSHLSDEAAQKVVQSLKIFAHIAFRLYNARPKKKLHQKIDCQ